MHFLDFEKPIAELEGKIEELRHLGDDSEVNINEEVQKLQAKAERLLRQTYARLTPWQKTQVARHPERPHFGDYVSRLVDDFQPLAGDRVYGEDSAIQGGLARFRGFSSVWIGQEKGHDTATRVRHNFGMARPEGYRKAQRLMRLAERFQVPIFTLVDTPGVNDLNEQRADITYGYVPRADVILYVLDATQILKKSEIAFIEDQLNPDIIA